VVGAELVVSDRGGDVTYHGPGQLVGYPVVNVPTAPRSVPSHVHGIEQVVIDTVAELGVTAGRLAGYPGGWGDAEGAGAFDARAGAQRRPRHGLVRPDCAVRHPGQGGDVARRRRGRRLDARGGR